MTEAKISNSRTSFSNSILNLCHSFKLPNYSVNEIESLTEKIIRKDEFLRVIEYYKISQAYSSKFSDKCGKIHFEYLLELIFCSNIPLLELENFKRKSGLNIISNSLNDLKLKIENKYLCFDNFAKYELISSKNYEVRTQFTIPHKKALMKMMLAF